MASHFVDKVKILTHWIYRILPQKNRTIAYELARAVIVNEAKNLARKGLRLLELGPQELA
jgi:hypothetical protein